MTRLLLTTCPGIEDIALEEVSNLLTISEARIKPLGVQGRLIVECTENGDYASSLLNSKSRLLHRVSILLSTSKISRRTAGLNDIYDCILKSGIEEYLNPHISFAVRAERLGSHEYTSMDIARIAGKAVKDLFSSGSQSPPVNLDNPAVIVRVDVVGEVCFVSICTTGDQSLHRRGYRVYDHPAALKPTIAYAMSMMSQLFKGCIVVDPMCGGGTIPIECCFINSSCEIYGMDISPKHVKGAKLNALAAGVHDKVCFKVGDARRINEELNFDIDRIISNLPYGIRTGRRSIIKSLYREFLSSARETLKDNGLITLLSTELRLIKRLANDLNYTVKGYRRVFHGNLHPFIIMLEKI
ncbi:MAG: class I SAM-dependent RNA methyltransferase [archaeon GB-1867-005]|nr:class I SAM-dependent RNA methyltransferase [Candidatus Culexmicrobium cathedralense]